LRVLYIFVVSLKDRCEKMRVKDFKDMGFNEQKEILKRFGIFSHDRFSSSSGKRTMYQVFGFMVEVNYHFNNRIHYIRVMERELTRHRGLVEDIRIHLN